MEGAAEDGPVITERIDLIFHITGQETEFFSGFYSGPAEDNLFDLFIFQRTDGEGYGGICLSRTGGTDSKLIFFHTIQTRLHSPKAIWDTNGARTGFM